MMKNLFQTLVLLFLLSSAGVYSENPINEINVSDSLSIKKKKTGAFELGIGIGEKGIAKYKANFIYCFPIDSNVSWGIGTGLHVYYPNSILVPLFVNYKANFSADKTTPYFSVNAGYYILNNRSYPGFLLNPTLGMSFKNSKGRSIDIGIGYDIWFINGLHFSPLRSLLIDLRDNGLISINLGLSF